jgi:hypothetical protein
MAYPIQTLADGRVKYSDGSIRGTAKTSSYSNMITPGTGIPGFQLTTMGVGTNAPSPNDIWVTQNGVDKNAVTGATRPATTKQIFNNPVVVQPQQQNSGGLTADILRSKFGFNDPNVINNILNDPAQREKYEREMNGGSQPNQTPARQSFADLLTSNQLLSGAPKSTTSLDSGAFTPTGVGMGPATLNPGGLSIENNPQFLNFSELWKNIKTGFSDQGHAGNWGSREFGLTEFLKPKIAYAADKNMEMGASTDQSGAIQTPDLNKMSSKASNLAVGSEVYPVQSLADGRIRYSDGSIKGGNGYSDLITGTKTDTTYKPGGAEKTATDLLDKGSKDSELWSIIDPNLEDEIEKQAKQMYDEGASEAEIVDFVKKTQEAALDTEYDRLNAESDALIPEYQRFANEAIGEVNAGQKEIEEFGAEKKDLANNTYAEKLLQSQLSKRADDTRMRNLFSSLGTAESSAFIENMGKTQSDYGKYETELGSANIKSVGDIDKELVKAKTSAEKQINSITADRDAKIEKVNLNKRLYPQEKAVEKQKILAQYKADMLDIYNNVSAQTRNLQNMKLEFMMGQSNIAQNAQISSGLLDKEYQLQQQTNQNMNKMIPPELDQELTGFSFRPQSSQANTMKKQSLKIKYPEWASLIESVYSGNDYNSLKPSFGVA